MPTIVLRDINPVVFLHNVGAGVTDPDQALEVGGIIHISAEQGSAPTAPADGDGGLLYTKADGKPYWVANGVAETDLTEGGGGSGGSLSGGANNKIAIWSGAEALTNDTNLHWDSTNDRLGIGTGTGTVDRLLHLKSTDTGNLAIIKLENTHATGDTSIWFKDIDGEWCIGLDSNDSDKFKIAKSSELSGSNEYLTIDTGGKVEIGGSVEIGGIIYGDSAASGDIVLRSTSGNANHSSIEIGTILNSDNGGISFSSAGASVSTIRMRIAGTTGNVGIGTGSTAPDQRLSVVGNIEARSAGWFIARSSDNAGYSYLKNPSTSGSEMCFHTSGEKMRILQNGNIGINDTTPDGKLTVKSLTTPSDLTSTSLTNTASATYSGSTADKTFDNDDATYWANASNSADAWIKTDFVSTKKIVKITVAGWVSGGWDGVKDFKFQASTDDAFTSPVTLHTKTGHPEDGVAYTYTFTNTTAYRYYRILINAGHDGNWTAVKELQYFEASSDQETLKIKDGSVILASLPTADPGIAGALWNSSDTLKVSSG